MLKIFFKNCLGLHLLFLQTVKTSFFDKLIQPEKQRSFDPCENHYCKRFLNNIIKLFFMNKSNRDYLFIF
jgi:hypothetical protein